MKYYLSRWFSIFQWLTGVLTSYQAFSSAEVGTCRAVLNMAGEIHFTTRFTLRLCHFPSIQQYLRFEWRFVSVFVSPISCFQSGCFKAWREHYCLSYWTAWSSFSFCVTVPVKKRKTPYCCRNLFFMSLKWALLSVLLQQLSADCVISVFCFFIMSFYLAAFSVREKSKIKMNSKSVDSTV